MPPTFTTDPGGHRIGPFSGRSQKDPAGWPGCPERVQFLAINAKGAFSIQFTAKKLVKEKLAVSIPRGAAETKEEWLHRSNRIATLWHAAKRDLTEAQAVQMAKDEGLWTPGLPAELAFLADFEPANAGRVLKLYRAWKEEGGELHSTAISALVVAHRDGMQPLPDSFSSLDSVGNVLHSKSIEDTLTPMALFLDQMKSNRKMMLALFGGTTRGFDFKQDFGIDADINARDTVLYLSPTGKDFDHAHEMTETLSHTLHGSAMLKFTFDAIQDGRIEWNQQVMSALIAERLGNGRLWLLKRTCKQGSGTAKYQAIEVGRDDIAAECAVDSGKLHRVYTVYSGISPNY